MDIPTRQDCLACLEKPSQKTHVTWCLTWNLSSRRSQKETIEFFSIFLSLNLLKMLEPFFEPGEVWTSNHNGQPARESILDWGRGRHDAFFSNDVIGTCSHHVKVWVPCSPAPPGSHHIFRVQFHGEKTKGETTRNISSICWGVRHSPNPTHLLPGSVKHLGPLNSPLNADQIEALRAFSGGWQGCLTTMEWISQRNGFNIHSESWWLVSVDFKSSSCRYHLLAGTHGLFILSNVQNVSRCQPGVVPNVSIPKFEKNLLNLRERKHIFSPDFEVLAFQIFNWSRSFCPQ